VVSDELRPLDLLLFNRTKNPWGAHVALYLGEDHAIHLSKKQSEPVIWPLAQFLQLAEYRNFIGQSGSEILAPAHSRRHYFALSA